MPFFRTLETKVPTIGKILPGIGKAGSEPSRHWNYGNYVKSIRNYYDSINKPIRKYCESANLLYSTLIIEIGAGDYDWETEDFIIGTAVLSGDGCRIGGEGG
jgi:hypothetical protein